MYAAVRVIDPLIARSRRVANFMTEGSGFVPFGANLRHFCIKRIFACKFNCYKAAIRKYNTTSSKIRRWSKSARSHVYHRFPSFFGSRHAASCVRLAHDPGKCITHSLFLIYYKPTNPHFYTTKVQLPKYRYRVLESTRYNY